MIRTVSTHTTALEAHVVKCRLEHEGMPAFVAFEHHIWAMWSRSVALGGVRVQVPESYLYDANIVVNNILSGKYEDELNDEGFESMECQCPSCNYGKVVDVSWPWKFSLVVLFIAMLPIPYTKHLKKCNACSHRWIASENRGYPLYVIFAVLLGYGVLMLIIHQVWCHWCRLHCELSYVCMP